MPCLPGRRILTFLYGCQRGLAGEGNPFFSGGCFLAFLGSVKLQTLRLADTTEPCFISELTGQNQYKYSGRKPL